MKKIICICVAIIVMLIPFTSFAATTEYNSGVRWVDIIEDNNLPVGDNYVIWRDTSGYYYVAFQTGTDGGFEQVTCNAANIADTNALTMPYTNAHHTWKVYKSRQSYNPYGTYVKQSYGYGDDQITFTWSNVTAICANSRVITNNNSTVFQSTPMVVAASNQGGTSPIQTVTSRRLSSQIRTTTLQGVLIEVISILPILVPVLVAFIAIRKGISFVLATLRTS